MWKLVIPWSSPSNLLFLPQKCSIFHVIYFLDYVKFGFPAHPFEITVMQWLTAVSVTYRGLYQKVAFATNLIPSLASPTSENQVSLLRLEAAADQIGNDHRSTPFGHHHYPSFPAQSPPRRPYHIAIEMKRPCILPLPALTRLLCAGIHVSSPSGR